jgi:hypothetical protein
MVQKYFCFWNRILSKRVSLPVRGTPFDLWAALATPEKDANGKLNDFEFRTLEAQDDLAGGRFEMLLLMLTVFPLKFFGTWGNLRFRVDSEIVFWERGSGVLGTGIETGFWNSGGGCGKRRPDRRPEAADRGTRSGWLQFRPVADLYCWSMAKRPLRTAFRSSDRFSRVEDGWLKYPPARVGPSALENRVRSEVKRKTEQINRQLFKDSVVPFLVVRLLTRWNAAHNP